MKPDEFEKQLQRQPLRELPAGWREKILDAARASSVVQAPRRPVQVLPWWREWLWPSPQAWAGLVAAWLVILGLNLTPSASDAPVVASTARPVSVSTATNLFEQRRELARLLDSGMEPEPVRKPPAPLSPRSELTVPPRV